MTDYRNIENHRDDESGGAIDVVIGIVAAFVFFAVIAAVWNIMPGCRTIDDVMQISEQDRHHYHKSTHTRSFAEREK